LDSDQLVARRSHSILKLGVFVLELLDVLAECIALGIQRRQAEVDDALLDHLREHGGALRLGDAGQLQGGGERLGCGRVQTQRPQVFHLGDELG